MQADYRIACFYVLSKVNLPDTGKAAEWGVNNLAADYGFLLFDPGTRCIKTRMCFIIF